MPWDSKYNSEFRFVDIVYEGNMTSEDLIAEEEQSISLAIENNTKRFLVDLTNFKRSLTTMDFFDCPPKIRRKITASNTHINCRTAVR